VVDYVQGELVFRWKHGGESRVLYAFPAQATIRSADAAQPVTSAAAARLQPARRAPAAR
jgi:hypothetical protein